MTTPSYTRELLHRAGWSDERIAAYERRVERMMAREAEQDEIDAWDVVTVQIEVV